MSSAKGKAGQGKQRQRHQNSFAWKPNKKDTHAVKLATSPTQGLCQRCYDIVEWRKRMNKYKPLTQPKTCVDCQLKKITDAYHVLCRGCAEQKDVCAKCQESTEIVDSAPKTPAQKLQEEQERQRLLDSMSERQRRSYLRKIERGDEEGAHKIVDLAAKNDNSGWSDFEDDFSDDEE
ncbi:hypothetical protein BC832DRAFT_180347 [Gaertneriomyces semiglobifer]|nr:hypothetical protein BC832DRAFT_180347 [Gaertneriomyces semiglobifer]